MLETNVIETRFSVLEQKIVALTASNEELLASNAELLSQRDQYKKLYLSTLELCRKLEQGILGQKRERFSSNEEQLTLALLGTFLEKQPLSEEFTKEKVSAHTRKKPTGRMDIPDHLPHVDVEVLPPEVRQKGLDAFERIGEEITKTLERRPASLVVVCTHKPKFVLKGRDRTAETKVFQATPPELPIERGLAGPGLLADTIVRRWQDHLPTHRLERIYGREGLELSRSTIGGWHAALADLVKPLTQAMWEDSRNSPYLCTDATGVLVQEKDKCRNAHFWVLIAPERHVLFAYSEKHNSAAVDKLLAGYKGTLVADAHNVYDHLFKNGVVESGCWAHARRYWFKALESDPDRARQALVLIGALFKMERALATSPPEIKLKSRKIAAKEIVDTYFAWCDVETDRVLDETPAEKAINYSRNQRKALMRFLEDERLPIHNNFSERELRREAVGRKNWLFVGSDEGGEINATFVTLLASCQMHGIEPLGYLRDLFCLLPSWPMRRVLELAPVNWKQTSNDPDAQQRLADNIYRKASLGLLPETR